MTTNATSLFGRKVTRRHKLTLWLISVMLLVCAGSSVMLLAYRDTLMSFLPSAEAGEADAQLQPRQSRTAGLLSSQPEEISEEGLEGSLASAAEAPDARSDNAHPPKKNTATKGNVAASLPVKTFRLDSIQPESLVQRFSGVVAARRSSRLAAKHLGRITQIHIDLGDQVRLGQVLAELDKQELAAEKEVLMAQLASSQARLDELQRGPRLQEIEQAEALVRQFEATLALRQANSKRTNQLVKTSSISEQEFDESVKELEATEAQLVNAQKTLELMREGTRKEQIQAQEAMVRGLEAQVEKIEVLISDRLVIAPFDGHVQARMVDEGVIVAPGQPIVEVVETSNLEVRVGLPAALINSGALDAARVICGKDQLSAELARVAPTIDQRTRNVEAVFSLGPTQRIIPASGSESHYQNGPSVCRVGQAIEVEIDVRADRSGWWIPSTALIPARRGLWSVMIAKPTGQQRSEDMSRAEERPEEYIVETRQVQLLRSSGDWSQLQGSFDGSDLLILSGLHRITAGQRIRSVPASLEETSAAARFATEIEK